MIVVTMLMCTNHILCQRGSACLMKPCHMVRFRTAWLIGSSQTTSLNAKCDHRPLTQITRLGLHVYVWKLHQVYKALKAWFHSPSNDRDPCADRTSTFLRCDPRTPCSYEIPELPTLHHYRVGIEPLITPTPSARLPWQPTMEPVPC